MDQNSPGRTPLWWVIPMMRFPIIDRNKGRVSNNEQAGLSYATDFLVAFPIDFPMSDSLLD